MITSNNMVSTTNTLYVSGQVGVESTKTSVQLLDEAAGEIESLVARLNHRVEELFGPFPSAAPKAVSSDTSGVIPNTVGRLFAVSEVLRGAVLALESR